MTRLAARAGEQSSISQASPPTPPPFWPPSAGLTTTAYIPEVSLRLNRAQELIDSGQQPRAIEELWRAERIARGNPDALREILEFAGAFEARAEPAQKSRLARLVTALEDHLEWATGAPGPEQRSNPWGWAGFGFAAAVGFLIAYGIYSFLVGLGPALDCGWDNAYPVGGKTAGTTIAPLLGLGLLTAGGFASWRWRSGRQVLLLLGLGALYIGSLVVIWHALPPGPYHCVWAP